MRKVIYAMNVSLDGYIEAPGNDIDWSEPDEELHRHFNAWEREIDTHLYGRRLYETMAAYWPTADQDPTAPDYVVEFARAWQAASNVVFSRTLQEIGPKTRVVRENIAEEVQKLKAQPGTDMAVGGPGLAATFMQLDLIDEYRLYVHPIVLGGGKRMFGPLDTRYKLQLEETHVFRSNVVLLRYWRPAGQG